MCILQELKGKFLIKGKRLNKLEAIFAQEAADTDVTDEEESGDEDEDEQKEKVRALARLHSSLPVPAQVPFADLPVDPQEEKKLELAKELSDMVIYCKSVHFHGFEAARKNLSFYEMPSFKEGQAVKLAEESGERRKKPSRWLL